MPQTVKITDLEFLDALDAWIERGRPAYAFADEQGMSKSAVSYRMRKHGLDDRRAVGLVDLRSGELYRDLRARGEFVTAETPVEVVA